MIWPTILPMENRILIADTNPGARIYKSAEYDIWLIAKQSMWFGITVPLLTISNDLVVGDLVPLLQDAINEYYNYKYRAAQYLCAVNADRTIFVFYIRYKQRRIYGC